MNFAKTQAKKLIDIQESVEAQQQEPSSMMNDNNSRLSWSFLFCCSYECCFVFLFIFY